MWSISKVFGGFGTKLRESTLLRHLCALALIAGAIALVLLVSRLVIIPNAGVLFLVIIVTVAYWLGSGPAAVVAAITVLAAIALYAPLDANPGVTTLRTGINLLAFAGGIVVARLVRREQARATAVAKQARRQAEQMNSVLNSMADEVWVADARGNVKLLNEAVVHGLGFSGPAVDEPVAELLAKLEILNPDGTTRPAADVPLLRALRGETLKGEEIVRHLQTGELRYRQYSAAPIREGGDVAGAVSVVRDVTDRKRAEQEREQVVLRLREAVAEAERNRAQLEAVFEAIEDGVVIFDMEGNALLVNEAEARINGFASAEEMRQSLAYFAEVYELSYPDGRPLPLEEWPVSKVLRGEHVEDWELAGKRRDTGQRWFFSFSGEPVFDDQGKQILAVVITRDITGRKQMEADRERLLGDVQRRAAELEAVLENMVDGVFVCDAAGRITLVNEAGVNVLGLRSADEVKQTIAGSQDALRMRRLDGRPVGADELPLVRALAGQVVVQEEFFIFNQRRNQDRYIRVSASPIRNEKGAIVGAVAVAGDTTELIELDKMKDGFVAVAAHELKTPVAIMKGYAQALLRPAEGASERQRKMLEAIDRGSERIDAVVDDLLDISRLYIGRLELEREPIDLPGMIAEVVDRRGLTAPGHRLRVVRADPAVVLADRARLEQVVVNLLDNAVKYSPEGGDVDVSVGVKGRRAIVAVRDYGVGIPIDKQQRIFQRFYRAHDRTPYDYGGMGVGLYISKEIVSRHGGRMWFESPVGDGDDAKGTAFYFSLPLSEGE